MPLILYDLAGADSERRFSPYCWRVRMALAHKKLPVRTIPWRFTEKDAIAPSGQTRVPVLVDGERWITDSWSIAEYLEDTYSDRPSLFGDSCSRALSRLHSNTANAIGAALFPFVALDILRHLHEMDKDYFQTTREARVGMPLETFVAQHKDRLPVFRASLEPLRAVLRTQPFFSGTTALYADYALFSPFQWARCISPLALLTADDPVALWRERMLDAFDGLARSSPGYNT